MFLTEIPDMSKLSAKMVLKNADARPQTGKG